MPPQWSGWVHKCDIITENTYHLNVHGLSFCILWTEYHLHQEDRHTKHCYHDLFSPLTNICLLSPSFPTEIGKGATYTTSTVSRPQGKQSTLGNTLGLDWNSNIYLEKFVTEILKINLLNNYFWSNLEPRSMYCYFENVIKKDP